jgi:polysaccharide biosynthesis protein PslG
MRHPRSVALMLIVLLGALAAFGSVLAQEATPATGVTYVVQPGDNLYRIAIRYGVSVDALVEANELTNSSVIFVGQTLQIPGVSATTVPTTAPSIATTDYTIQRGDSLNALAAQFNTTVDVLLTLNNLSDPNRIFVGQVIQVPSDAAAPTDAPVGTEAAPAPTPTVAVQSGYGFSYGVEAYFAGQDVTAVVGTIQELGMQWVKVVVNWRDLEPTRGNIDFAALDSTVAALNASGVRILFTVTGSPAWARSFLLESGPPDDLQLYGQFIGAVAQRYAGRVQAYEIWSEPNRRYEWSCSEVVEEPQFCSAAYIDLLQIGYQAVKTSDPNALVISAGLAPTGYNDGVNAIDDRIFLRSLYRQGLAEISDAIGAHPLGWANPPDATCCDAAEGVTTHFENRSFYFLDTLNDYRDIIVTAGDGSTPIWVTSFGWGTAEGSNVPPPDANNVFVTYTSLTEQAAYLPAALQLGSQLGFIGPMFLTNLNGCQAGGSAESCYYSLQDPSGANRPSFSSVQSLVLGNAPVPMDSVPVEPTLVEPTPVLTPTEVPSATPLAPDQVAPEVTAVG